MAAPRDREDEDLIPAVGVNNIAKETALPINTAREAVNVDFSEAGRVSRRQGRTKVINGALTHSLWRDAEFPYALYADGGDLYAFDRNRQRQFVTDGLSPGLPVSYARINDAVYWSNGMQSGMVTHALEPLPWAPAEPPGQPTASPDAAGGLDAGAYQVAITYRDILGRESGCGESVTVNVAEGGGIRLTNIPAPPAADFVVTVRVYRTGANDGSLRHVADIPAGMTTTLLGVASRGRVLDTQFLRPLPPGQIVRYGYGRQWVARDNELLWSSAMRYGVYDPAANRLRFPAAIDMVALVGGGGDGSGVAVAAGERTYWLSGGNPADFQQRILHPAGAVRGTALDDIPAKSFGLDSEARCSVWLSRHGFYCVLLPGGQLTRVNDTVASIDVAEEGAAVYYEADGTRRILASMRAPTTYGLRVTDSAVARTVGPAP